MINNQCKIMGIFVFMSFVNIITCLLTKNIAMKYLYLDTNRDNLVSLSELNIKDSKQSLQKPQQKYYSWKKYQLSVYPNKLFDKYDQDRDSKISFQELDNIIEYKIKKYAGAWAFHKLNFLKGLQTSDYLSICDMDQDQYLNRVQFVNCMKGFIIYQYESYPYKIKSLLFPNRTIGYDFQQFKKLLPQSPKSRQIFAQKQLKFLFESFQWPESKIPEDQDDLIGPEEGRFMEPTILYFYLDKNWDEQLDKTQILNFLKNYGGEEAFDIADSTGDGELDQAQIISYFMFAMCIEDCSDESYSSDCMNEQKNNLKYDTSEEVCSIYEKLHEKHQIKKEQKIKKEQNRDQKEQREKKQQL